MKTHSARFFPLLLFLLSTSFYEPNASAEFSTGWWAHIPISAGSNKWLINVEPNQTIRACGMEQEQTVTAIKDWASRLGRDKYLKIVVCDQGTENDVTVNVTKESCQGVAFADPDNRRIVTCNSVAQAPYPQVILHEVGHLWGLCDLYQPSYARCDMNNGDGTAEAALMRDGVGGIQKDDIDGLMALAKRSEFPANKKWDAFLQNPTGGSSTEKASFFLAIEESDPASGILWIATNQSAIKEFRLCPAASPCSSSDSVTTFSYNKEKDGIRFFKSKPSAIAEGEYKIDGLDQSGARLGSNPIKLSKRK